MCQWNGLHVIVSNIVRELGFLHIYSSDGSKTDRWICWLLRNIPGIITRETCKRMNAYFPSVRTSTPIHSPAFWRINCTRTRNLSDGMLVVDGHSPCAMWTQLWNENQCPWFSFQWPNAQTNEHTHGRRLDAFCLDTAKHSQCIVDAVHTSHAI